MKAQQGFTFFEMIVVVAIISIISTGWVAWRVNDDLRAWFATLAETETAEIVRIASAAQAHFADAGAWPDQANRCADGYLEISGRLTGLDNISPFATPYEFNCATTGTSIRVSNLLPDEAHREWAVIIAAGLPGASVATRTDAAGDITGYRVNSDWPVPAEIPLLAALLPRDGSRAMTGDLDLGGHNIVSASTVTAGNVVLNTGHSLANTVNFAGIYPHRPFGPGGLVRRGIPKPACSAGFTPQIFLVPIDIRHASGRPLTQFAVSAIDHPGNPTGSWQLQSEVHDTSTVDQNSDDIRAVAFTKCSPV